MQLFNIHSKLITSLFWYSAQSAKFRIMQIQWNVFCLIRVSQNTRLSNHISRLFLSAPCRWCFLRCLCVFFRVHLTLHRVISLLLRSYIAVFFFIINISLLEFCNFVFWLYDSCGHSHRMLVINNNNQIRQSNYIWSYLVNNDDEIKICLLCNNFFPSV